jgi:hypothetical protein
VDEPGTDPGRGRNVSRCPTATAAGLHFVERAADSKRGALS